MPDLFAILAPSNPPSAAPALETACDEGQIQARILGHGFRHGYFGPITYDIQVIVPGAEYHRHIVQRRYSTFSFLDAQLRPHFPHLPPLPPKSTFRKRLCPSSFVAVREQRLGEFLTALLKEDPGAKAPDLKRFLAVGLLGPVAARATGAISRSASASSAASSSGRSIGDSCEQTSASGSFRSTNLSMISEELHEDEWLEEDCNEGLWDAAKRPRE